MPRGNFAERSTPDLGTLPPVATDINPTPLTICERDAAGFGRFVGIDSGAAAAVKFRRNNVDFATLNINGTAAELVNDATGAINLTVRSGNSLTLNAAGTMFLQSLGGFSFATAAGAAWISLTKAGTTATLATDGVNAVNLNVTANTTLTHTANAGAIALQAGTINLNTAAATNVGTLSHVAAGACSFSALQDTTWTWTQAQRSNDAPCKPWTIAPQTGFATAAAANRTGAPLAALLAPQTNGGGSGAEGPSLFSCRWEVAAATVLRRADIGADRVQTTDATGNVTCAKHVIADATIEAVQIRTVVRKPSTGDCGTYIREVGVKRHGGGASQQVGATATPFADNEDAALAACNVGVAFGGADYILAQVTGIAATTLEWGAFMRSFSITP